MKKLFAPCVILLSAVLCVACGSYGAAVSSSTDASAAVTEPTETVSEKVTETDALSTPTNTQSVTPTDGASGTDVSCADFLSRLGLSEKDVLGDQLLTVDPDGTAATLYRWERENGAWRQVGESVPAYIGRNGVSRDKTEGDGTTPVGLFPLGEAFGMEEMPETKLTYRRISDESYWVDDGSSKFYNQWVEGTAEKDWNSAEHLSDYPTQYALGVIVVYNVDPILPYRGSAIFIHCGERSTAGCVAVSHDAMAKLLCWLDPTADPAILICPEQERK